MYLFPRIGKTEVTFFQLLIYLISFPQSVKYFTNAFYYNEVEKTEVIFCISLYFCFYLQELENISRIGKNFNDLYYFQKVKNIRAANCKMYLFISTNQKNKLVFRITHLILFPKVENNVRIKFFGRNKKNLIDIYMYMFASIFTKWKVFHQCLLIPQSGKTELVFFIPLYFCFYFHELENISPVPFTSTKWKKPK